jgi:hypothetical protein
MDEMGSEEDYTSRSPLVVSAGGGVVVWVESGWVGVSGWKWVEVGMSWRRVVWVISDDCGGYANGRQEQRQEQHQTPNPSLLQGPRYQHQSSAFPLVPLCFGIEPNERLSANVVAQAEHLGNVDVEGAVGLGAGEQLVDRRHGGGDCVGRGPRRLEQIEADFARVEVDVGVADGRDEAHRGRDERVGLGNVDVEEPAAAWRN